MLRIFIALLVAALLVACGGDGFAGAPGGASAAGAPEGGTGSAGAPAGGASAAGAPEGGTGSAGAPAGGASAAGAPEGGTGSAGAPAGGVSAAGAPEGGTGSAGAPAGGGVSAAGSAGAACTSFDASKPALPARCQKIQNNPSGPCNAGDTCITLEQAVTSSGPTEDLCQPTAIHTTCAACRETMTCACLAADFTFDKTGLESWRCCDTKAGPLYVVGYTCP